jgi:uncharacterized membrane protein HdeD (DUF308 family)
MSTTNQASGMTSEQERGLITAIGRNWWVLLFVGIVSVVVGVLIMVRPAGSTWVLAILLAIYLFISGIFQLVRAFSPGLSGGIRALLIIGGAIGIILGAVMFRLSPEEKVELLGLFLGIWFLFAGVNALFNGAEIKEGRGWAIFSGIVYVIAGIVLVGFPLAVATFVWVVGIWLVVLGLFEIISAFQVKSAARKLSAG